MATRESGGHILVVEDHEPTARIIAMVLEAAAESLSVTIAHDGEEGWAAMQGEGDGAGKPDLVVIDLDLPVLDGHSILRRRQEDPTIMRVPTIVLSGIEDDEEIALCYEAGANAFIEKPGDLDDYESIAEQIAGFWFETASLPRS